MELRRLRQGFLPGLPPASPVYPQRHQSTQKASGNSSPVDSVVSFNGLFRNADALSSVTIDLGAPDLLTAVSEGRVLKLF